MNKKAIAETTLNVIVAIVVFILLIIFTTTINSTLEKSRHREICRLSIVAAELGKKAVGGTQVVEIDCDMITEDISRNSLPKQPEKQADFIKTKFAQAMYDAWYVSGRGEHRKFQEQILPGGRVYCLLYERINLEDIQMQKSDLGGITQWLSANNPKESSQSYFSYLTYGGERAYRIVDAPDPDNIKVVDEIDPSKNYYVVFWATFKASGYWAKLDVSAALMGLINLIADNELFPQVIVVPEDQFQNIGCDRLLN